jgi:hypothetical protein
VQRKKRPPDNDSTVVMSAGQKTRNMQWEVTSAAPEASAGRSACRRRCVWPRGMLSHMRFRCRVARRSSTTTSADLALSRVTAVEVRAFVEIFLRFKAPLDERAGSCFWWL